MLLQSGTPLLIFSSVSMRLRRSEIQERKPFLESTESGSFSTLFLGGGS